MTTSHQPTDTRQLPTPFRWQGGAVRLVEPITDVAERTNEWGHAERDEFTVPFGPWSTPDSVSGRAWVWRYGVASNGTGASYQALATRVHADVASRLGGPIVVALLSPWRSSHAFAAEGYLDESYVAEKLGRVNSHRDDVATVTELVRVLLGRVEVPVQGEEPTS